MPDGTPPPARAGAVGQAARRPGSLRLRLMLLSAASVLAALAIVLVALTAAFDHYLERRVEQELEVKLRELAAAFGRDAGGGPALDRALADPRYDQPYSGVYWQVSGPDGTLLRSRSLWDRALPHDDPRGRGGEAYEITWHGGVVLYVHERDVRLTAGGAPATFRLAVAIDHAELEALGGQFRTDALIALGPIAAALVLGAWLQLGLGLGPLRRLQAEVALIRDGRAARLAGSFPAELEPLVESLNALIDGQEASVARARARAGDLAHGLKTPLAILAAEARRLEEAGNQGAAARLREQIDAMRAHVERQLARARSHGAAAAGGRATDVGASVERLFGLMRRTPRGAALAWRCTAAPGLQLRMDPDDFGEVVGNLLENAALWARGRVSVVAREAGGLVEVAVEDDGPGIPPERRSGLARRGESAAPPGGAGDPGNGGLGLAIVADVLGLYGTAAAIGDAAGGGCRVAFSLPGWRLPAR